MLGLSRELWVHRGRNFSRPGSRRGHYAPFQMDTLEKRRPIIKAPNAMAQWQMDPSAARHLDALLVEGLCDGICRTMPCCMS